MEIKSRTVVWNCDGTLPGEIVADIGIRENLIYRRVWAAAFCAYPSSLGGTHARPVWRSRILLTDDTGDEIEWMDWRTDYSSPGLINPSTDNENDAQWGPPFVASVQLGDPDKPSALSFGPDARVLHRRISNYESVRATCLPMSITGRYRRIRMLVDQYSDNVPGQTYMFGGLMIQSQSLPYT